MSDELDDFTAQLNTAEAEGAKSGAGEPAQPTPGIGPQPPGAAGAAGAGQYSPE